MPLLLQPAGAGARRRRADDRRCGSTCSAQAADLGVLQLHLSGGEPTVRRDLEEIVAQARQGRALHQPDHRRRAADARAPGRRWPTPGSTTCRSRFQDAEAANADRIAALCRRPRQEARGRAAGARRSACRSRSTRRSIARTSTSLPAHHRAGRRPRRAAAGGRPRAVLRLGAAEPRRADADPRAGADAAPSWWRRRASGSRASWSSIPWCPTTTPRGPSPAWAAGAAASSTSRRRARCCPATPRRRSRASPSTTCASARLRDIWLDSEAFKRFRGTDWMPRALPLLRPARDRLGRLPLPGLRLHRRCGRDRSGLRQVLAATRRSRASPRRSRPLPRAGVRLPQSARGARHNCDVGRRLAARVVLSRWRRTTNWCQPTNDKSISWETPTCTACAHLHAEACRRHRPEPVSSAAAPAHRAAGAAAAAGLEAGPAVQHGRLQARAARVADDGDAGREDPRRASSRLPAGFKVELWAHGMPGARMMARGDKGTIFVGTRVIGKVYAVTDKDGKRTSKVIAEGLQQPNGIAFKNGSLYVIAIDKALRFDDIEDKPRRAAADGHQRGDQAAAVDAPQLEVRRRRPRQQALHRDRLALQRVRDQHRHARRRSAARTSTAPAWRSWRAACATRSASTGTRRPRSCGSPTTAATGRATTDPRRS